MPMLFENCIFLRAGIWEYNRTKCPLFVAKVCNDQFSEILQETIFSDFVNDIGGRAVNIREFVGIVIKKIFRQKMRCL